MLHPYPGEPLGEQKLVEHHPIYQKVVGLIASQGTYLSCEFNPWLHQEETINVSLSHQGFSLSSLSLSPPPLPSL